MRTMSSPNENFIFLVAMRLGETPVHIPNTMVKTEAADNTILVTVLEGRAKGVEENGANQFEIKAAVQAPDSVQIRSGYSANAEIVLERAQKTLALPESTVEFSGDSTFVYVLTDSVPQQKFKRRQIEVGMSDGIKIAVKSGLTAKDKVRGAEKKDK